DTLRSQLFPCTTLFRSIGDVRVADIEDNASELLKGARNTKVEVGFLRQGETMTATIVREEVEVDAVPFYGMIDSKTGYIVLSRRSEEHTSELQSRENLV